MEDFDFDQLSEMGFLLKNAAEEDLFWAFEKIYGEISLIISWSLAERSFQTLLKVSGTEISRISSEGMKDIKIVYNGIKVQFDLGNFFTELLISNGSPISYVWGTLEQ